MKNNKERNCVIYYLFYKKYVFLFPVNFIYTVAFVLYFFVFRQHASILLEYNFFFYLLFKMFCYIIFCNSIINFSIE